MFKIKLIYTTGNTFETCEVERFINCEWDTEEKAIHEMNKIREHWIFNKKISSTRDKDTKKKLVSQAIMQSWYKPGNSEYTMLLVDNDGNSFEMYAAWLGYFEILHSTEVVNTNQLDNYIDFDELRSNMGLW